MKPSKSGLFLMELMVAFLFFSLASTVCIQLFVKAHLLGTKSTDQSQAVMWTETLAEAFYAVSGDTPGDKTEQMAAALSEDQACRTEESVVVYLDHDWSPNAVEDPSEAAYTASASLREDGKYIYADIAVFSAGEESPLYALSVRQYIQERRAR